MPIVRKPEMMTPRLRYRVTYRSGPPGRQSTKQFTGKFLEQIQGENEMLVFALQKYWRGQWLKRTVSIHTSNFLGAEEVDFNESDEAPRRV